MGRSSRDGLLTRHTLFRSGMACRRQVKVQKVVQRKPRSHRYAATQPARSQVNQTIENVQQRFKPIMLPPYQFQAKPKPATWMLVVTAWVPSRSVWIKVAEVGADRRLAARYKSNQKSLETGRARPLSSWLVRAHQALYVSCKWTYRNRFEKASKRHMIASSAETGAVRVAWKCSTNSLKAKEDVEWHCTTLTGPFSKVTRWTFCKRRCCQCSSFDRKRHTKPTFI